MRPCLAHQRRGNQTNVNHGGRFNPSSFWQGKPNPLLVPDLRPQSSRGAAAEQPRDMNRSRPQRRQFRKREQAADAICPCPRTVRERVRHPRAQTRKQTVRIRDQASASKVCDQTPGSGPEQSADNPKF